YPPGFIEYRLQDVLEVAVPPLLQQALLRAGLHEGPESTLLIEHALVYEFRERLGGRRRVDAEVGRVLRCRHDLLVLSEVALHDVLTDLVCDLSIDGFAAVEHCLTPRLREEMDAGAWVHYWTNEPQKLRTVKVDAGAGPLRHATC